MRVISHRGFESLSLRIVKHKKYMYKQSWKEYLPLGIIVALITVVAGITGGNSGSDIFILHFMAGFFLVFGGFKLISLKEFAHGYATYDVLAQRWFAYGYVYPFVEIAFGLMMLVGFHPDWLLWTEAVLMIFSGIGVLLTMRNRQDVLCVCLGSALKAPLTHVTLIENFGMAALAIVLIL